MATKIMLEAFSWTRFHPGCSGVEIVYCTKGRSRTLLPEDCLTSVKWIVLSMLTGGRFSLQGAIYQVQSPVAFAQGSMGPQF